MHLAGATTERAFSSGDISPDELMACLVVVLKPFDDLSECDGVLILYLQLGSCTYIIS